jgi:hypothetical protein
MDNILSCGQIKIDRSSWGIKVEQEEAVMVGIAPQFPQEGAHFFESCTVGHARSANHAACPANGPAWSSMVPQSPANSSMFQQWSRKVPQMPRKFPQRLACWTCGTMGCTKYFD